ncbi:MAG TPA: hypothetical protein VL992_17580, partial [Tepidisphaeraceae bacterium]|nr:hypothetical protein [Tepidisphaeraceae bacterium]
MNNKTKIIVALVALIVIIAVPSVIIWKFLFSNSDNGLLVVNHTAAAAPQAGGAGPTVANGQNTTAAPITTPNLTAVANAGRRARGRRIRQARGQGAIALVSDALPGELSPG